ncbi:Ribonuclease H-like domain containing protein [Hyaloscypha variabilis]|jgi:ribonuclease HI
MVRVRSRRDIGPLLRSTTSGASRRRARIAKGLSQTKVLKSVKRRVTTGPPKSNRVFDEERYGITAVTDESSGLRRLETDPQSIVVAISGSCKENGFPAARAGYGVFFSHHAHDLNKSGEVPTPSPQTSNYSELYATMQALESVHQLIIAGEDLTHVIVKTDSSYLALGLSEHIWKWSLNGFRNWKGQPVVNGRAFKYLHEKVGLLEKEYGIHVSFCLVRKEFNQHADALAKAALV